MDEIEGLATLTPASAFPTYSPSKWDPTQSPACWDATVPVTAKDESYEESYVKKTPLAPGVGKNDRGGSGRDFRSAIGSVKEIVDPATPPPASNFPGYAPSMRFPSWSPARSSKDAAAAGDAEG